MPKLCWDNIDEFKITKNGYFRYKGATYKLKSCCLYCGNEFMSIRDSNCCDAFCFSFIQKGKFVSYDTRMKQSSSQKIRMSNPTNNPMYGKNHTERTKLIIGNKRLGFKHSEESCLKRTIDRSHGGLYEPYNYKGVADKGLALFDTYGKQLNLYDDIRCGIDNILEVKCLYCGKWFNPHVKNVKNRLSSIKGQSNGEGRFYCSDGCKQACPIFNKRKYPEGYAPATSREMQPQFRKKVLERDNWTCQRCGASKDTDINTELHAHHIDPVSQNPIESCDVDNGITLCKKCHGEVHKLPGCSFEKLRCNN